MNELPEIYNEYIKQLDSKIELLENDIIQLNKDKVYLETKLISFNDLLSKYNCTISNLNTNIFNNVNTTIDREKIFIHYCTIYTNSIKIINSKQSTISQLSPLRVSYDIFKLICNTFNFEISKHILNGYSFNFFGKLKGKLYIKESNNTNDNRIDWNASYKYKKELIKQSIVPYSKTTPTGIKWFQYHIQDFNYWWVWERISLPVYAFFTFKPTNGCNTKDRSQSTFVSNCTTKDEILNTTKIGNKDKMFALLKFDKQHYLKYKNNIK